MPGKRRSAHNENEDEVYVCPECGYSSVFSEANMCPDCNVPLVPESELQSFKDSNEDEFTTEFKED